MDCSKCGASNPDDATFCRVCGNNLKSSGPTTTTPPPSGAPPMGSATYQMSTAFGNAIALVKNPVAFMKANKDNLVPLRTIIVGYVAILAVIPFIATLIGDLWVYAYLGLSGYAVVHAIITYILDVGAVIVIGIVIWKLGPTFGTTVDQSRATLLAAFVYTPVFLISILNIIPFLGLITILGVLYGLYILYLGLPIILKTPTDKVITYVVAIVIATFVVYAIIAAILAAVTTAFILSRILFL